jgi:glycerol uptake facilitator-like aquaporin
MVNLLVKTQKTSPTSDGFLSCLGVALTLLAMITISGQKSGGCINPAVAFGQTVLEWIQIGLEIPASMQPNFGATHYSAFLFMYIGAEVVAGILAGFFHRFHVKTYKEIVGQAG